MLQVESLVAQLVFLGVDPYCRIRGTSGEAALIEPFWEAKVSKAYASLDTDAYELVMSLLSQVMLRHSKKHLVSEINLKDKTEEQILLNFEHPSERAVYLSLEAYAQEETMRLLDDLNMGHSRQMMDSMEALNDLLSCACTHPSLVRLEELERLLKLTFNSGFRSKMLATGLFGTNWPLQQVMMEISNTSRGYEKLLEVNSDAHSRTCIICKTSVGEIKQPVLFRCCLEIMCKAHVFEMLPKVPKADASARVHHSARSSIMCPHCDTRLTVNDFTPLATPLSTTPASVQATNQLAVPAAAGSLEALRKLPPRTRLQELRHWVCDGGDYSQVANERPDLHCHDGTISRKPLHFELDGLHFCSRTCAESAFNRAFFHYPEDRFGNAGARTLQPVPRRRQLWRGLMAGQTFSSAAEAAVAMKERLTPLQKGSWEGVPLYTREGNPRSDPSFPLISNFRASAGAPAGNFLAHYDVAGGERPYGVHPGAPLGTKLARVVRDVNALPDGSKVVIFSAYHRTLTLLKDALAEKLTEDAIALVGGSDTAKVMTEEISRFRTNPKCVVLLLAVRMCATGLTLTTADHCFLMEPQEDEATEVQLINRIFRIGQQRAVVIKKYAMRGTIEERRLTHRKHARGLLNEASTDESDKMTTQETANDEGEDVTKSAIDLQRVSILRQLFGFE